jgi:Reverse transcriptase (RNA-dependent DNA polymerase)
MDLMKKGEIRPRKSPYGAPLLFVKDGDKPLRGVVDYRALNRIKKRNNAPLPGSDEMFDRLGGAKVFSKLDLKTGFHQIRLRPGDIEKTAFNTKYGQFEYLVMPMGLCNAPATFQTLMNNILYDFIDEFLVVYMDDLLIFSNNEEDHMRHVEKVLMRLKKHELYVSPKKCLFMSTEMEFLGFIVGKNGLLVDPKKIEVIESWPRPSNITEVRSFLGIVQFSEYSYPDSQKLQCR